MSIVEIIKLPSFLIALTKDGYLVIWSSHPLSNQNLGDLPLIPNDLQIKVSIHKPLCLFLLNQNIVIVSERQVKQIALSNLYSIIKKGNSESALQQFSGLKIQTIIKEQQNISTAIVISNPLDSAMIDEQAQNSNTINSISSQNLLIWVTKNGKIFSTPFPKNEQNFATTPQIICNISSSQIAPNHHEHATSILTFRQGTLLLIGTSAGRVLIASVVGNKLVDDITGRYNLKLLPVLKIVMGLRSHKFFTVHENCVVEWSMQLQRCLGYYGYNVPSTVFMTQKISRDQPKIIIAGGSRYLQIIDANNSKNKIQYETSLQSVSLIRQFEGDVYCGGSFGMIQVINLGVTKKILFRSSNTKLV